MHLTDIWRNPMSVGYEVPGVGFFITHTLTTIQYLHHQYLGSYTTL